MSAVHPLDAAWRADNPLPAIGGGEDKNERGRVVAVGGSRLVPGAIMLTGEAALRVGAGKVQLGTIAEAAMALGARFPEAAIIGLQVNEDGEIGAEAASTLTKRAAGSGAVVIGPGMATCDWALVEAVLSPDTQAVIDAGAMSGCRGHAVKDIGATLVMTPHHGELANLLGCEADAVSAAPERHAREAAEMFGAIIVLKDARTLIVSSDGEAVAFTNDGAGLGTAGSGDVLAGVIGGLLARGMPALAAAGWGVWLHAAAGRAAAKEIGALGFLARELLPRLPRLIEAESVGA